MFLRATRPPRRTKPPAASGHAEYPDRLLGFDRPSHLRYPCCAFGEVAEWSKALAWKVSNIPKGVRGFESHPLRQSE